MDETKNVQVNRCFGGDYPKNPEQQKQREQKIKEVLSAAVQRKRANKEIDWLRERFHHKKTILELLPAIKRQCDKGQYSPMVLTVALERVERKSYELGSKDAIFLAEFKASLEKSE